MSPFWLTVMWFAFLGFLYWIGEDGRRGLLLWSWVLMLLCGLLAPFF